MSEVEIDKAAVNFVGNEKFEYILKEDIHVKEGEQQTTDAISDFQMPGFEELDMPFVKVKYLEIQNYKIFPHYTMNFVNNGQLSDFACFIGPNGCGKSTTLEIIQLLFSNYDEYDKMRLRNLLGKCVRHVEGGDQSGIYGDSDFHLRAILSSSLGDYEVVMTKEGFQKGHPTKIRDLAMRLCYFTRFDQELTKFQLDQAKWPIFKELFEAVTGFEIEEEETAFAVGDSRVSKEFVFGFYVHKPNETIHYKECSDGERKIMKTFSSLLNLEYVPSIILVDNVEMHVESGRHLPLVQAMKRCFRRSQIITTTHSYHISRNFSDKNQVYDLRLLSCIDIYRQQPWRLVASDEVQDALVKLNTLKGTEGIRKKGSDLLKQLNAPMDIAAFKKDLTLFLTQVICLSVNDLV